MQIGSQDAVFDHHGSAALVPFVVIIQCAAFSRNRSLIDDRDERLCHFLADHVGINTGALAIEVGFHAVADSFVQQDAACAGRKDDRHFSGWRSPGFEQDQGPVDSFPHHLVDALVGIPREFFPRGNIRIAGLRFPVTGCRYLYGQPCHRPVICNQVPIQCRDQHPIICICPEYRHFLHRGIRRARDRIDALQYRQLLVDTDVGPGDFGTIEIPGFFRIECLGRDRTAAVCDRRGRPRRCQHGRQSQVFSKRVTRLFADHDA